MPVAVIDANVIIEARNRNATAHPTALEIAKSIDTGALPTARVPDPVVPEILHPLQRQFGKATAYETLDWLHESRGFDIVHVGERVRSRAERLFRHHDSDSGPEWTDCVIAAYMLNVDVEYIYSFDDDFDAIDGITRLTTAINPFDPTDD